MSTYEIINGVYKGPKHFRGDLYLKGTPLTDLGNLTSVEGDLWLPNGKKIEDFSKYKQEAKQILNSIKQEDYALHVNHENLLVRGHIHEHFRNN